MFGFRKMNNPTAPYGIPMGQTTGYHQMCHSGIRQQMDIRNPYIDSSIGVLWTAKSLWE